MRPDDHGLRGGEFARTLRGELLHLDDDLFELLFEACRLHTDTPIPELKLEFNGLLYCR